MLLNVLLTLLAQPAGPAALPTTHARIEDPERQPTPAPSRREQVRERYRALFEARDEAGLAGLWRQNPDLILYSFEEDLEAGLALWERSAEEAEKADAERIEALWERALFGARIGSAVTGRPIFHDYAAAFVGWNEDQRRAHRVQQLIYQRALGEVERERPDPSGSEAQVAREVWERALDLGDWWGVALGYEVEGRAHLGVGRAKEALIAFSQARLYFHQLGLASEELEVLVRMVSLGAQLEAWPRARALANDAVALARASARGDELRKALEGRARAERALGALDAAAATKRELEALER